MEGNILHINDVCLQQALGCLEAVNVKLIPGPKNVTSSYASYYLFASVPLVA